MDKIFAELVRVFSAVKLLFAVLLVCGVFASLPSSSYAIDDEVLTIDLAKDQVDITLGFNGAHLALFGVKDDADAEVAMVVRGPEYPMIVRRKDQVMGIWLNRQSLTFNDVPVYYDFAIGSPEDLLTSLEVRKEHEIGLDGLFFKPRGGHDEATIQKFREALIRNKQIQGHFPLEPKKITYLTPNFFRADFYVPPDVPTGAYIIETFLFKDQKVMNKKSTQLRVAQVGFNYSVNEFAHSNGLVFGLVAVMFAMVAGWGAFIVMRR